MALVSLLGLINTVVMAAPRILYGLGRDGLLPELTAAVNPGGTPVPALLITTGSAALLVLAGSFERLLAMGAVLYVSLPLAGIAALLALRWREPELPRPFRTWGYPWLPGIFIVVSAALLVNALYATPRQALTGMAIILAGLPFYWYWSRQLPAESK